MARPLLIAAEVSRTLRALLERDRRFDVLYRPASSEPELIDALEGREIAVTRHYNKLSRAVVEAAKDLRVIAQGTTGLDNIDEAVCRERGIAIIDAAGENANAVAELVISNMISLTRTVPLYGRMISRGEWLRQDCDTRHELRHFRLGIVGIGNVGTRVARLSAAFGVKSIAYDPYLDAVEIERRGAQKIDSLDELLAQATILTLHVPLTDETRDMIGSEELHRLARGSFVINASRGEVLDVQALFAAVRSNHIAGAALDVYDPEPPRDLELLDDPRLIFTPHIAGCSFESKASIGEVIYKRLCAHFGYEPLPTD